MSKDHVQSNKISSNHTTLIEPAAVLMKEIVKMNTVRRVVPGMIISGLDTLRNFAANVKISKQEWGVELHVRSKIAVQEVRIYGDDPQYIAEMVARTARNEGYHIYFNKREVSEVQQRPPHLKKRK